MLSQLVGTLFELYGWLIFGRILLSWIRLSSYHPIVTFLFRVTEPVLLPFRKVIPPAGGIDFSPLIVFMLLRMVGSVLTRLLWSVGL